MSKLQKYLEAVQEEKVPRFKSANELTNYLNNNLIPDLKESGRKSSAEFFDFVVKHINNYNDEAKKYIKHWEEKMMPDLEKSARHGIVNDYKEAIYWIKKEK